MHTFINPAFDLAIAVAYMLIPLQIGIFAARFPWSAKTALQKRTLWFVATLFMLFIISCGSTHGIRAFQNRVPEFGLALANGVTAVVSLITALSLCFVIPHVIKAILEAQSVKVELTEARQDVETAVKVRVFRLITAHWSPGM